MRSRRALPLLLLALVAALPLARAQDPAPAEDRRAAVLRADADRLRAMLDADLAALDRLLTADCLYVHSTGATQTKEQFIEALRTGAMKYTAVRYTASPLVRLHGDETAVLTGTTQLEVALPDGRTVKPKLLVTALYVVQDGRWQLASYQSTNAPAAP